MATQSIVGDKSLAFAKRIAKCYRYLYDKKKEEDEVKEAGETDYWLDVIHSAEYLTMSTSVATRHNWSKLRSALAAPSVH